MTSSFDSFSWGGPKSPVRIPKVDPFLGRAVLTLHAFNPETTRKVSKLELSESLVSKLGFDLNSETQQTVSYAVIGNDIFLTNSTGTNLDPKALNRVSKSRTFSNKPLHDLIVKNYNINSAENTYFDVEVVDMAEGSPVVVKLTNRIDAEGNAVITDAIPGDVEVGTDTSTDLDIVGVTTVVSSADVTEPLLVNGGTLVTESPVTSGFLQ